HPGLIVGHKAQDPGKAHQVLPHLKVFVGDDPFEVHNAILVVPISKIQAGNFIVEQHDVVLVDPVLVLFDSVFHNVHQIKALVKGSLQKMKVQSVVVDVQKGKGGDIVIVRELGVRHLILQTLQYKPEPGSVLHKEKR